MQQLENRLGGTDVTFLFLFLGRLKKECLEKINATKRTNAQWAHWALQGHNNITCGVADIQSSLADILSSLADILSCLADILSDGAKICLSEGYFAPIWLCFLLSKDKIYTSIKKYSD